jgi:hypothetical protein
MSFCGIPYTQDMSATCVSLLDPSASAVSPFVVGPTPDPCFFNINGIYAMRPIPPFSLTFDSLYSYIKELPKYQMEEASGVYPPDPYSNQRTSTDIKMLSFQQYQQYQDQLSLFRMVYTYNAQAYAFAKANNTAPQYYRFLTASQLTQYNSAMSLVNKLYNVNELYPYTCLFYLPFPPFCNP